MKRLSAEEAYLKILFENEVIKVDDNLPAGWKQKQKIAVSIESEYSGKDGDALNEILKLLSTNAKTISIQKYDEEVLQSSALPEKLSKLEKSKIFNKNGSDSGETNDDSQNEKQQNDDSTKNATATATASTKAETK